MSIKITKEPTVKRLKSKCLVCGCEFEFSPKDARWSVTELNDVYGNTTKTEVTCKIECPCCGTYLSNYEKVED